MNICVSVNAKYLRYLSVMICSLKETNKKEKVIIYILHNDLMEQHKKELCRECAADNISFCYLWVDVKNFSDFSCTLTKRHSMETFYRFMIPSLLPSDVDRVLYLDVDIIVRKDLRSFYYSDFEENLFCACQDMLTSMTEHRQELFGRSDPRYFNAGVVIWNLQKLRERDFLTECMEGAKQLNYDLPCKDQEVLNYLYYDKVRYLPADRYNYLVNRDVVYKTEYLASDPYILHYAGRNPWEAAVKSDAYKEWWIYAKKTPYYTELLEEQLCRMESFSVDLYQQYESYRTSTEAELKKRLERIERSKIKVKELFEKSAVNNSVILYGAGKGLNKYFSIFGDKYQIAAVLDNAPEKVGKKVVALEDTLDCPVRDNLFVESGEKLFTMDLSDRMILLTGLRRAGEVATQLEEAGIKNYFLLSDML